MPAGLAPWRGGGRHRVGRQRPGRRWRCVYVTHSACATPCSPRDCSPPGSSVHGLSPGEILEEVAISFSRGSSQPRNQTRAFHTDRGLLYGLSHQESLARTLSSNGSRIKFSVFSTLSGGLGCSSMKVLPGITFLIIAPFLFIVLVSSVLVRPSGLFLLLQCFLFGPGPLPLLSLLFLLLGQGCFLLRSLEGQDTTRHWMWPLHKVH